MATTPSLVTHLALVNSPNQSQPILVFPTPSSSPSSLSSHHHHCYPIPFTNHHTFTCTTTRLHHHPCILLLALSNKNANQFKRTMPTPLHNATLLNYGLTKEQQIKIRGALSPTILHLEDKLVFSKALKIEPNMKKRTHAL